jgi:hypothetical protein
VEAVETGSHRDEEQPFGEEDLARLVEWLRSRGAPEDRAWVAARQLARRAGQIAREESTTPEEALRGLLARVVQAGTEPGSAPG